MGILLLSLTCVNLCIILITGLTLILKNNMMRSVPSLSSLFSVLFCVVCSTLLTVGMKFGTFGFLTIGCLEGLWIFVGVCVHACVRVCAHACMHTCVCVNVCVCVGGGGVLVL